MFINLITNYDWRFSTILCILKTMFYRQNLIDPKLGLLHLVTKDTLYCLCWQTLSSSHCLVFIEIRALEYFLKYFISVWGRPYPFRVGVFIGVFQTVSFVSFLRSKISSERGSESSILLTVPSTSSSFFFLDTNFPLHQWWGFLLRLLRTRVPLVGMYNKTLVPHLSSFYDHLKVFLVTQTGTQYLRHLIIWRYLCVKRRNDQWYFELKFKIGYW